MSKDILFPVGRLVGGSLYKGQTKNDKNEPLLFKDGSPRTDYGFAVAYAKNPGETHWSQTAWGAILWAEGNAAAPGICQNPAFAWKVVDGDSQIPNKKGKKPAEREGYPGHWVVWYSGSYAPKIFNKDGTAPIIEPDAVKAGYFIQVFGNIEFNKRTDSPGMYQNYSLVAFNAYGTEIQLGDTPDASAVGFGQTAAPAGALAAPAGGMSQPPASTPAPAPSTPAPSAPPSAPPAGTTVTPAPNFLEAPPAPTAPAAPPAPTGPQPTAKAWTTLEGMLAAQGWTLELLIKEGYVTAG